MTLTRSLAIVLCLALAGCDKATPTAPTAFGNAPDVAGTYSGPLTVTVTDAPGYNDMRGTSTFTVTVTQSGNTVTLSGTQTWPGESPEIIWDGVMGTIDASGIFTWPTTRDTTSARCGRVRYVHERFQFSAGSFSIVMVAETDGCGQFEYRGTLPRL